MGKLCFEALVIWGSAALFLLPPPPTEESAEAQRPDGEPLSADESMWLAELMH